MLRGSSEVGAVQTALDGIRLLQAIGGERGGFAAAELCNELLGGTDIWRYRQEDSLCTACFCAKAGKVGVYVQHGTDLPSQNFPQISQFVSVPALVFGGPQNQPDPGYAKASAKIAQAILDDCNIWNVDFLFIFSHSQGAGIALNVMYLESQRTPSSKVNFRYISFGGNAVANRSKRDALTNFAQQIRWMNAEDAVPTLPWILLLGSTGAGLVNTPVLQYVNNIVHCGEGRVLQKDGTYFLAPNPPSSGLVPLANLVSWLDSFRTGADNNHQTSEYAKRLTLLLPRPVNNLPDRERDQPDAAQSAPINFPVMDTTSQVTAEIPNVVQRAAAVGETIPPPPVPMSPGDTFKAGKVNGMWFVFRGPVVVQQCGGKREARGLARNLNRIERATVAIGGPQLLEQVASLIS